MVRSLGSALSAIQLISCLTTANALRIERRAGVVPTTLPGSWVSKGCWVDVGRTLTGGGYDDNNLMTDESCINYCNTGGFIYAGTEYSSQCYCGNTLAAGSGPAPGGASDCSMTCTGNATEACGGPNRLNLFWSGTNGPQTNPGNGSWTFSGCWTEGPTGRALPNGVTVPGGSSNMTVDNCLNTCQAAGYVLAGAEYSGECWCANTIQNGATLAPEGVSGCNMLCNGNHSEFCGGPSRLDVYDFNNTVSLPPWTTTTTSTTTTSTSSSSSVASSSTSSSVQKTSPTSSSVATTSSTSTSKSSVSSTSVSSTVSSSKSSTSTKVSSSASSSKSSTSQVSSSSSTSVHSSSSSTSNTSKSSSTSSTSSVPSSTSSASSSKTSSSVATSSSSSSASPSKTSSSVATSSSSTSTILGPISTISTSSSATASPTLGIKQTLGAYSFMGCYTEATNMRALTGAVSYDYTAMTLEECLAACTGFTYWGVEYGGECYCGNVINPGSVLAANQGDCSFICPGSPYEYCGAGNRLEMYGLASVLSSSSVSVASSTSSTKSSSTGTVGTSTTAGTSSTSGVVSTSSTSKGPITSTSSSSSGTASPTLGIKQTVGAYTFQGCYTEATNERALTGAASYDYTAMTLEECATNCAGFTYWGVEYGGECYCGNVINPGSVLATNQGDCSFICPGSPYEYCGAGNRLEMYALNGTATSSKSSSATGTTGTSVSTGSVSKTSSSATTGPTIAGYVYQGCYVDGLTGRDLNYQQPDNQALTVESCIATCAGLGYTIAGMEFSVQCFCDNFLYNGAALAANQGDCNMACGGNAAETCGAGNRLSVYSVGKPKVYQPPAVQTTGLPANWVYKGCLQDNTPSAQDATQIISTFPYQVWNNATGNDAVACITQCQQFGFNAAGVEYGSECYCGDVENIYVASWPGTSTNPDSVQTYTYANTPQIVPDSECNAVCTGNASYLCGSGNLLSYYAWDGPEPLYTFGFPTGEAAGSYDFLIGGVVVPLMTSQVVTGKVTFTEKYGSGEPNGTGAYELDLTEIDNWALAWRTMTGLETDVFCSAGLTLPDKAGRQITVGGWAGQSNFGVRTYWPDGSAGVPGTNEWQEDPTVLSLQVPRWYPSAMVMANGSIMIVGGEIGSNDAEQPTLELLPATGVPEAGTTSGYSNTTVYLDFLQRTAPFNLYPFVCVVPSGIFIAYYNEARILDEVTFETIKTLPNMPAAVNDPTGGRTYQLEGSMVLLPQHAPYTDYLGVLICGGSTSNGGYPIDNCISTQPEAPGAEWTIERMPSRRVMPCMAGLPDGTYVIVNGAQHGVAGFGLGGDPNYNAVLYDPTKPVNARMSIMANTTVARLYHSEAIVLLDGRVLISGSDPTGDYVQPAGEWPEEYRVEVFSPPYLLSGAPRPSFTLSSTDWAYGDTVTVTVTPGAGGKLTASMLGSVVSTHGNAMGQRTIFPEFSCSGDTCTVTAPPNAHVAPPGWFMFFVLDGPTPAVGQFIRIGKDPANIGNWPAGIAAFEPLPGV